MLEILIAGIAINIFAALIIFHRDKQCYSFFELIPIPYGMVTLILVFLLVEWIQDRPVVQR